MDAVKFVKPARRVEGAPALPGDKSISHRAALFAALAEGRSSISNFLTAEDCLNTLNACAKLGAAVERQGASVTVTGRGQDGLRPPDGTIDCGNSGTGVRLLAGVLAGQPFQSEITGDAQVQRRPMDRVIQPLALMGAHIESRPGGLCPLRIHGRRPLRAIDYDSPVASAQVKSCVLLAGLFADGVTRVTEPAASRDHTERLLRYFGVPVHVHGRSVSLTGGSPLQAREVRVPGDLSAAAFFLAAAALLPGSDIQLENAGTNPGRTGILEALAAMGAAIGTDRVRESAGEPVADLRIRPAGKLFGVRLQGDLIPRIIDELPVLAVAAACAEGTTVIADAAELRFKETDRIRAVAQELGKLGVSISEQPDGLIVTGGRIRGGEADSRGDHRLAMSLAVAGLVSEEGVAIRNPECVNTSFPDFWERLEAIAVR